MYTAAADTKALRAIRKAAQKPGECKKHAGAPAAFFHVMEPGRRVRPEVLCVNCALVLTSLHGAMLAK